MTAQAQKQGLQGTWFVTSQVGYQQTKTGDVKSTNDRSGSSELYAKPTVAVGAAVSYMNIKSEDNTSTLANTGLVAIEPLVRKYWGISGGLYFFSQLTAPIITGKEKRIKVSQFGLSASGGMDMILGKHFSVEFSYNMANLTLQPLPKNRRQNNHHWFFTGSRSQCGSRLQRFALGGNNPTLTTPLSFSLNSCSNRVNLVILCYKDRWFQRSL